MSDKMAAAEIERKVWR